jgi:hypothetical protein
MDGNSPQMLSRELSSASPPTMMLSFPVFDKDDDVVATCLPPSSKRQAKTAKPPMITYFLRGDGPRRRGPPAPLLDVGRAWYFLDANMSVVMFCNEGVLSDSPLDDEEDTSEDDPEGDPEAVDGGFTRLRSDCERACAREETVSIAVDSVFESRWPVLSAVIQLWPLIEAQTQLLKVKDADGRRLGQFCNESEQ